MKKTPSININILWKKAPKHGVVEVKNGLFNKISLCRGDGECEGNKFSFKTESGGINLTISEAMVTHGPCPTLIYINCGEFSFSFILRDALFSKNPIYLSEYEVVVVLGNDSRNYNKIVMAINLIDQESDFQRFEREPEETWKNAAKRNRKQHCPTWLGVSRDMRIFRVEPLEEFGFWGEIIPAYHSQLRFFDPEEKQRIEKIKFAIGQGSSCQVNISRRLDDGVLPILNSTQRENAITYNLTMFATLENSPLETGRVRGSDFLACYANSGGNMLTDDDREKMSDLLLAETDDREEEIICRCQIQAVNNSKTPSYAWFKVPYYDGENYSFDENNGYSCNKQDNVFSITLLEGKSVNNEELSILIQPSQSVTIEFLIPHSPISKKRADKLRLQDFNEHLKAAREFWQAKLNSGASVLIPEPVINELIQAGLLHCDIATIGKEPNEPLAATIGWYSPIGSESAPIIQFFDSMGWHNIAERSIEFFLKRQLKNGSIQNFAGYESETGPLLWTMGEHFRYTRDEVWLKRVKPHIDQACNYLLDWRERNKKEELRECGSYGLVDGKVADPEDFYHQFFLNAGTYAGLKSCVEMYEQIDQAKATKLRLEVADYRKDLRYAFYNSLAEAPVIPTNDGSWVPFSPPWSNKIDATALYIRKGKWFTHGSFLSRESLIGPLYLVFHEVLDVDEIGTTLMLKANQSPVTVENACLSQPYYCRHDFAHLKRGEIKSFLKTYYNQLTGLIDQETYSFWEHYFHASQHKTHEEGWFLMQTRWMLYLEDKDDLKLFSGIPRKWLEPGKNIKLDNVVSYFGKLKVNAKCSEDGNTITCKITITDNRKPKRLIVRLPHCHNSKAQNIFGGEYDKETETVTINNFSGNAKITLQF